MANAHHIRTSSHDAGVNRPFVRWRFFPAKIVTLKVQHDEPIQSRPAGTHTGQSKKSVGTANAHAHMTIAVGDAFAIEDVTAVDQFLLEFLELNGIESGHVRVDAVHWNSFAFDDRSPGSIGRPSRCQGKDCLDEAEGVPLQRLSARFAISYSLPQADRFDSSDIRAA